MTIALLLYLSSGSTWNAGGQDPNKVIPFKVDREHYFTKHDMVYQTPAYEGFEGFPLGNGDLGGMIWSTPGGVKIQINKSDTYDRIGCNT